MLPTRSAIEQLHIISWLWSDVEINISKYKIGLLNIYIFACWRHIFENIESDDQKWADLCGCLYMTAGLDVFGTWSVGINCLSDQMSANLWRAGPQWECCGVSRHPGPPPRHAFCFEHSGLPATREGKERYNGNVPVYINNISDKHNAELRGTKNYVSITNTTAFSLLGPIRATKGPFQMAPKLIKLKKKSNVIFSPTFLCHIEPAYQKIMSICPQLCLLAFRALLEKRACTEDLQRIKKKILEKGPQRAKNQYFEKQKIAFFSHVPRSIMPKN